MQTDTALELDVVTGAGVARACSPERDPDLFRATLAGLGQSGIITRVRLRLVPAPAAVRRYTLYYPSVTALAADQRRVLGEGRFDHLQGQIVPGPDGWRYLLEAGAHAPAPPPGSRRRRPIRGAPASGSTRIPGGTPPCPTRPPTASSTGWPPS